VTSVPEPAGLLAALAALGPFFAVEAHEPGAPLREPWQPLAALVSDPSTLTARIGQVREGLAATTGCPAGRVEFRIAASVAQLGVAARLLSPALGAAALGGALRIDAGQARWVPALGGPFRLSLPASSLPRSRCLPRSPAEGRLAVPPRSPPGRREAPPSLVAALLSPGGAAPLRLAHELLAGPVTELVGEVAAMSVSPLILWGNVASAINGAAAAIVRSRPDLAGQAGAAAGAALAFPALGAAFSGQPGTSFRRRSCCLIYRLGPAAGYCGDCVLGAGPGPAARSG
jgi:hypothetical protein